MLVARKMVEQVLGSMLNDPYHKIRGLVVPKFVTQETLNKLKTFQLYPDDVWVVSFPKSGTTWIQQIVRLIRNNGVQDDVKIDAAVPFLEAIAIYPHVKIDELPKPRSFKSHFPYHILPCGPPHTTPCKYIYVARNPKDVAVSLYFQNQVFFPNMDWNTHWKKFLQGDVDFGNYFDHVLSWWSHREDPNVLILKYENMKKDLSGSISQIASFLGVQLSSDVLQKIAHLTTFDVMKDDNTANLSWMAPKAPWLPPSHPHQFIRKGIVGDWKNFFSAEQSSELEAICASRLKDTGLEFDYEI